LNLFPIDCLSQEAIKLNTYYPAYFSSLKTGWEIDTLCKCYPVQPDFYGAWRGIVINAPQKIYIYPSNNVSIEIPVCTYEKSSLRKIFWSSWDYTIFIRDLEKDILYEELLDISEYSYSKKKYPLESKVGQGLAIYKNSTVTIKRNFNLLDYINLPIESGNYEIFVRYNGVESNHWYLELFSLGQRNLYYPEHFIDVVMG